MRFKSKPVNKYLVYAVTGTNSASFAIDATNADTRGLLGFSVKRTYTDGSENFIPGFKVFKRKEAAVAGALVSTETDPIQSFVWDDFTLQAGKQYTYTFIPITGKPDDLKPGKDIPITIQTEPAFSNKKHDVFFNRGVASSQAYAREFHNTPPDKLVGKKQQDAFNWLGRDLYPAILRFIGQAQKGDTLLCAFYEFNYPGVLDALKEAIDRGVDVQMVVDMKKNKATKKDENAGTPRTGNLEAIKTAKLPMSRIIKREANRSAIHHNKFMVFLKGKTKTPVSVWLGSTNITESGIFGQTNVGHWVRDKAVCLTYKAYWELLSKDPGAKDNADAATKKKALAAYKKEVVGITGDIDGSIPAGITCIFSPRVKLEMLKKYFELIDKATSSSVITLAFGINADLKKLLLAHTAENAITFMMLEKPDKPTAKNEGSFIALTAKNNVYDAFGSYLTDPLYKWTKETYNKKIGLTTFVNYVHSKFLVQDPLGDDPIVVTGSANFSGASTTANDENMIVIRGDQRAADIYFTEFNRIFNHYYFRSVVQQLKDKKVKDNDKSYFLDATDGWMDNYKPGSLREKRVKMFIDMKGTQIL